MHVVVWLQLGLNGRRRGGMGLWACVSRIWEGEGENANKGGGSCFALVRCVLRFVDGFWFVILRFKRGATRIREGESRPGL